MADEPNQTLNPEGNSPEARLPTGELKDQNPTNQGGQNPEAKPDEGGSFLTKSPEAKPEAKPEGEGEKKPEGKEGEVVAAGAPEKYADFKLPEGYQIDAEVLKSATTLFKEAGLSQESAQKLIDFQAKNFTEATEAPYKLWADTQKEWMNEIGERFGSKADGMRTDINKAIDNALSPTIARGFRSALDFTGAGSNPDFVEALHILAKPFLEGSPVLGGKPSAEGQKAPAAPARPTAADAMYPHLIKNRE